MSAGQERLGATSRELDEARKFAEKMASERDWEIGVVQPELRERAERAEQQVAALREALRALLAEHYKWVGRKVSQAEIDARAALAALPSAPDGAE